MEQFLGLPPDGSAHGPAIDNLIGLIHWLMLVLFVGWGTFYVTTLIRFRTSRHPKADYGGVKSHFSTYAEAGVLVVEVLLLIVFSIPLWSDRVDAFPSESEATVVRIVAEQFAWNVHYPGPDRVFGKSSIELIDSENPLGLDRTDPNGKDDITTINQLNVPVNTPVLIHLTTKDVIHSLSLPPYRVKQDAIPGIAIPVWFTPVKTTDEIREEMRTTFSVAQASKRVRKISLPAMSTMSVSGGAARPDEMLMQDAADSEGNAVLSKGDMLTAENVAQLAAAGIKEVATRPMAKLENFYSMDDMTTSAGVLLVAKNDPLTEDAVSAMVEAGLADLNARAGSNMDIFVLMEDVKDQNGASLAAKGDALGEDVITKLAEAGIAEVALAPATPTEIACAQLCGLGHYRMRGYVTVQTPEAFKQWMDAEQASLTEAATSEDAHSEPSDSTAVSAAPAGEIQH